MVKWQVGQDHTAREPDVGYAAQQLSFRTFLCPYSKVTSEGPPCKVWTSWRRCRFYSQQEQGQVSADIDNRYLIISLPNCSAVALIPLQPGHHFLFSLTLALRLCGPGWPQMCASLACLHPECCWYRCQHTWFFNLFLQFAMWFPLCAEDGFGQTQACKLSYLLIEETGVPHS